MSLRDDPDYVIRQLVENPRLLFLGACVFFGGLLGLIGPFGTFSYLNTVQSVAFWTAIVSLAMALMYLTGAITERLIGVRQDNRLAFDAVHTALFALLFLEPLYQFVVWMAAGYDVFDRVTMLLIVVGITVLLNCLRELALIAARVMVASPRQRPPAVSIRTTEPPSAAMALRGVEECPLLARLPEGAEPIIWSISSNNHYIDVRGPQQTHTVLMRFSDAMRALGSMPGMQIHRSHWVAEAAVDHWFRDGHRLTLVTRDGMRLPVSKTYTAAVQARWPDAERDASCAA